jgi:hypothetical protein
MWRDLLYSMFPLQAALVGFAVPWGLMPGHGSVLLESLFGNKAY